VALLNSILTLIFPGIALTAVADGANTVSHTYVHQSL